MRKYVVSSVQQHSSYFVISLKPQHENTRLRFVPGQYAAISFKSDGRWSSVRCFSMINSPGSEELQFSARYSGKFTRALANLTPGTPVNVQGAYGTFTIDSDFDKRIVMLAAGIGITPFMSMLRQAADTQLQNPITLIYACRNADDIPFYDEIRELQRRNPRLQVAFIVRNGQRDKSRHIFARPVDDQLLARVTDQRYNDYSYFICGPKGFNETVENILRAEMVDDERIVTESFTQTTTLGWGAKLRLSIPSLTYAATGMAILLGVGFFMALDLTRYVPKAQASTANESPATSTDSSTSNATTSETDQTAGNAATTNDSSSTNSGNTTSNNTTTPSTTTPTPSYTQTYQAPVSTVS